VSSTGVEDTEDTLGKIPPDKTTDCITMNVEICGFEVETVLDTGSGVSLISNQFLESLDRIIESPSNVDLIDVNGNRKRALGKVKLLLTIGGEFPLKVEMHVTDATNYNVILGTDWLVKTKAEIKPVEGIVTLNSHNLSKDFDIQVFKEEVIKKIPGDEEYEEQEIIEHLAFLDMDEEANEEENDIIEMYMEQREEKKEKEKEEELQNLTKQQQEELQDFLFEYNHMFADDECDMGETYHVEHTIPTFSPFPIFQPKRSYSEENSKFIKEEVQRMLAAGIIRESHGDWSSPPVIVSKKNGKKRFCVDYRQLNKYTEKDKYPLPKIDTLLSEFQGAKYYTSLDMKSGYWQVRIAEQDRKKTAFQIMNGFYEFIRMPFGLTNAPSTFQRLMDSILRELLGEFAQVYLDDIIIYSKTWEDHLDHLEQVFERLYKAGLKLGREKCVFAKNQIQFLGHVVSEEGIKPDPQKLELLKDWPIPRTKKDVRSFVGFASYYRKFIAKFSEIAQPLHKIMNEKSEYIWEEKQQQAFDKLREELLKEAVLQHPNFSNEFIVSTDASGGGLGAILSQIDNQGRERPIAFASKSLIGAQHNYCATDLELLAVKWAVTQKFKQYLLGRKFTVITDHEALKFLLNKEGENLSKRMQRWILSLTGYDFKIEYKPGKKHQNVDALSRMNFLPKQHPQLNGLRRPEHKSKVD
jgi:hypothetical protein